MQAERILDIKKTGTLLLAGLLGLALLSPVALQAANYDSGIFEFQQRLAKGGNAQAQYKLATMYENGRGVGKDINKAKEWYRKSAKNNYNAARYRLTLLEVKATGFKPSHKPWFQELRTDAKNGNSESLFILGNMYEDGIGVKRNLSKAAKYYKTSSSKGNVDAESRLFEVEEKISKQKARSKKQQEAKKKEKAAKKAAKEKQSAEAKRKAEKDRKAKAKQQEARRVEQERRKLEAERRKLAEERRRLEAQKKAIQAKKAEAAKNAAKPAEEEKFESDLCSGRAAKFRTQCK